MDIHISMHVPVLVLMSYNCACAGLRVRACMYVCMQLCMCVCVCVCVYVCVCLFVCVCVYSFCCACIFVFVQFIWCAQERILL